MREGSYMEIQPGMKVHDARGQSVGVVEQVIADEASGIFHGLAVRHGLLGDTRMVPGEQVEAVHDGTVTITGELEGLHEYVTVEERMAKTQKGYV